MSKDRLFPPVFAKLHPRFQSPTFSLFLGAFVLSLLCLGSFIQLVSIYSITQMLSYLLIYCSYLKLKKLHPEVARPFAIPGKMLGFIVLVTPAILIAILSIVKTDQLTLPLLALASGPLAYIILRQRADHGTPFSKGESS
jgi:amino acid transporter